ncbi:MAG: PIN domain-containing protein [Nitrospirae bacterium]|nr:PIN domain-containing protein [Nitrospirota bacterium]
MKLPKKIIDANVILRFFLADVESQFLQAKSFLQLIELGEEDVLMTEVIFAEVVWVLSKVYNIPRTEITEKFSSLINYEGIKTILNKDIFLESLRLYAMHSMDIQDIFLAVLSKSKDLSIVTFDKKDFKKLGCSFNEP